MQFSVAVRRVSVVPVAVALIACGRTERVPSGGHGLDSGSVRSGRTTPIGSGAPDASNGSPSLDAGHDASDRLAEFLGAWRTESAASQSAQTVVIESANGDVYVIEGNPTEFLATFRPFVFRAHDSTDAEVDADLALLETSVTTDASGSVLVRVSREAGAPSTLGADIVVELPASFDGALQVIQGNGRTEIITVGEAVSLSVASESGWIDAHAGSVEFAEVSTANGDVQVGFENVPPGATGRFITEQGDVRLFMPALGAFTLHAVADVEVSVSGYLAPSCHLTEAVINSKTVICGGGGATYVTEARGPLSVVRIYLYRPLQ